MKYCPNCGNKAIKSDKFCTKCGANLEGQSQNVSDTSYNQKDDKVNKTVTDVKEKVQQTFQNAQEFVPSEQFQNGVDNLKETVGSTVISVKEKAQQAAKRSQEFVQSEQFQKAKSETIKRTHKFFDCTILSDEEYWKSAAIRRRHIYLLMFVICIVIALLPMQNYVGSNSFAGLLKIINTIGIIALIPVMLISGVKIGKMSREMRKYRKENQVIDMSFNFPVQKYISIMAILSVVTAIFTNHWANNSRDSFNDYLASADSKDQLQENQSTSSNDNTYESNQSNYSDTEERFVKDDEFILEYVEKIDTGFAYDFKIEGMDKYNRYLIAGLATNDYRHLENQAIVYILQINDDYTVDGWHWENPSKKQLTNLLATAKSEGTAWNESPIITSLWLGK